MDKTIFCTIIFLCAWGKLIDGLPIPNHRHRVNPQAYNWLDVPSQEQNDEPRELSTNENARRMQANRNR